MVECVNKVTPTKSNRLQELVVEWTEQGFSPELIRICSNTPFIKNLESLPVSKQEVFGAELDEIKS